MQYKICCKNCQHEKYCHHSGFGNPLEKQGICNPDFIFVLKDELRNKGGKTLKKKAKEYLDIFLQAFVLGFGFFAAMLVVNLILKLI